MTTNHKIALSIVLAVIAIVLLYIQPKYVVDNEKLEKADQITQQSSGKVNAVHSNDLREDLEPVIYSLKSKIEEGISENILNFADSLATIYFKIGFLDSAVNVAGQLESLDNKVYSQLIGDIYYRAYNFSVDKAQAAQYSEKAIEKFAQVLDGDSENIDVKVKMAMIMVSSENPMQGILMLREIADKNPDHWDANFNLGLLSIQSGQYARAVERFEKLVNIDPKSVQANFYLAFSLFELGEMEKAKEVFIGIKSLDNDPTVLATVDDYLQRIEKNSK